MDYIPYITDGKLFIPEITLNALIPHGIDMHTALLIRHGITKPDANLIHLLMHAVEEYRRYAPDSEIARQLSSQQFQHMLMMAAA